MVEACYDYDSPMSIFRDFFCEICEGQKNLEISRNLRAIFRDILSAVDFVKFRSKKLPDFAKFRYPTWLEKKSTNFARLEDKYSNFANNLQTSEHRFLIIRAHHPSDRWTVCTRTVSHEIWRGYCLRSLDVKALYRSPSLASCRSKIP